MSGGMMTAIGAMVVALVLMQKKEEFIAQISIRGEIRTRTVVVCICG